VIIIYGINQAQSVLVLLLVSVFLALIGTVPVLWTVTAETMKTFSYKKSKS